ncbi:MAG: cyanophycin synthetase [Burkholderiales bacterium]|nr:cyanophycin synthetase [Burkholderiales bacterium]
MNEATPAPVATAPLRVTAQWKLLQGSAFGLPQRTIIGEARVRDEEAAAVLAGCGGLHALLEEPVPQWPEAADDAERVVRTLAFVATAIQQQARVAVDDGFGLERLPQQEAGDSRFELALPAPLRDAAIAGIRWAAETLLRLAAGKLDAAAAEASRKRIQQALQPYAEPGINRQLIVMSALRQRVPIHRFDANMIVLGTGARSRWTNSTITDGTPSLGVQAAKRKQEASWLLRSAGLPGGDNRLVSSRQGALAAARELGYPVVVKPDDRDKGEGVTADLRTEAEVVAAYDVAVGVSRRVLVEKFFPGYTHRINVRFGVADRAARKIAGVVGDGASDVAELVRRQQQTTAHREQAKRYGRYLLQLDDEALGLLQQMGRDAAWVPPAGEYVRLRRRDNAATGGTNEELDVNDPTQVHPDNVRLALDATRLLRLDVAGIDIIMGDVSKSWLEVGALVCEVNAQPQVPRRDLIDGFVRELVEAGGRIPAELFVCPAAPPARQALVGELVASGRFRGVSDIGGLHVRGHLVTRAFEGGFDAARGLLLRKDVETAACVMSVAEVAKFGLPLDRWNAIHFSDESAFEPNEQALLATARRFARGAVL